MKKTNLSFFEFLQTNFHHFNARELVQATEAYNAHLAAGGKMMITLGGAMSSARLGITLAEMIRQEKVHIICCTGANLEESIFRLIANSGYKKYPDYRYFTKEDDTKILELGERRVTDMAIPEERAFRVLEPLMVKLWTEAHVGMERRFHHEYFYKLLLSGDLEEHYDGDPEECWLLAAAKKNIPIIVAGGEDSTMGNIFASYCYRKELSPRIMKSGIEYMIWLYDVYQDLSKGDNPGLGFFQIAGGISGDFPICVVPSLIHDLGLENIKPWGYFCQISDSTTSYGSYSGATPNEKITWDKLTKDTPMFVIESDATIVAPLVFEAVLDRYSIYFKEEKVPEILSEEVK